jgi:hypothetical protein
MENDEFADMPPLVDAFGQRCPPDNALVEALVAAVSTPNTIPKDPRTEREVTEGLDMINRLNRE